MDDRPAPAPNPDIKPLSCWIVTEGLAGTENQCIGVAEALDVPVEIKRIRLNNPWKTLSPYLGFEGNFTFSPALLPPWPDLLLTSGRKSIAAARFIKRQSSGRTVTVHLQDPRISAHHFDLVAVPAHDSLRADNVIVTAAAPNRITKKLIDTARLDFQQFENIKQPRVAVLIGGTSKAYRMTAAMTESLASRLLRLDASLMITCSRRTPAQIQHILKARLSHPPHYLWDGTGANPYHAMISWADIILVTADSVSMISESCTAGKPVYMIPLKGGSRKFSSFHESMIERGTLRVFEDSLETFAYEPLNDAKLVADAIKSRFPSLRLRPDV